MIYVEKTKESTNPLLELISELSKVQDTRSTKKNELYCCKITTKGMFILKVKVENHKNHL